MARRIYKISLALIMGLSLAACQTTGVQGLVSFNTPSGKDRHPGVIVLPTSFGINSYIIEFGHQLSRQGYVTAVVDFIKAKGGVDNIEAAYDFLSTHPAVLPDRIGLVGFSKGANNAVGFAQYSHNFTKRRVQAIVGYYSGPDAGPNDERHPPILFLHGDQDIRMAPSGIRNFCKLQKELGTHCEFHIYEGVGHSFTHRSDWGTYDPATTTDAFKRAVRFLDKHLKGAKVK